MGLPGLSAPIFEYYGILNRGRLVPNQKGYPSYPIAP